MEDHSNAVAVAAVVFGGGCGERGVVETVEVMVVECCWHYYDMLARLWSFLSVLLQAFLLMESLTSIRL